MKNRHFATFISKVLQGMAMVTIEDEQELICDLSNGAISNDLLTPYLDIECDLTLNMVQDRHTFTPTIDN